MNRIIYFNNFSKNNIKDADDISAIYILQNKDYLTNVINVYDVSKSIIQAIKKCKYVSGNIIKAWKIKKMLNVFYIIYKKKI